ncbi:hypothetical protein ATCV1_z156L [Acanthocystis turfacea chlorella virus 1]|uniref:Uncharacterized protein z156L n=1 Tax=Chlorovirus heliozoae TaxID=322019 RepID=A7K8B6_9PHYC|nr:hypothetical protein ATCV1_z156L [Acanthocystis turfacea chlorella virus 1]ABT16290.1 hypothetical protein ATCV1_z156L [Acanthocystis turfacea chlorella virus 1]
MTLLKLMLFVTSGDIDCVRLCIRILYLRDLHSLSAGWRVAKHRIHELAGGLVYFLLDVVAQFVLEEIIQDVYTQLGVF